MKKIVTLFFFSFLLLSDFQTTAQVNASKELLAKYAEFDFWIGDWNVYKYGTDTIVGSNKIESILYGRAIRETYNSTSSPYAGTSLNKYDPRTKVWEQFWVDNGGMSLSIKGGIQDGKMILENMEKSEKTNTYNRITWTPNEDKTVRQEWEQSTDGEIWNKVFDGLYKLKE